MSRRMQRVMVFAHAKFEDGLTHNPRHNACSLSTSSMKGLAPCTPITLRVSTDALSKDIFHYVAESMPGVRPFNVYLRNSATPLPLHSPAMYLNGQDILVVQEPPRPIICHMKGRSVDSTPTNNAPVRKSSLQAAPDGKQHLRKLTARHRGSGTVSGAETDTSFRRARSTTRLANLFTSRTAVPDMLARLEVLRGERVFSSKVETLEADWREIVKESEPLSRRVCEQQAALWEMISSEHAFLRVAERLIELADYLRVLRDEAYLMDVNVETIFMNIREIYQVNLSNWNSGIVPILTSSRSSGLPFDPVPMSAIFDSISTWSSPYVTFNIGYESAQSYVRKERESDDVFAAFISWAMGDDRLSLEHHLARVMQRLTKYPLLLHAVLAATTDRQHVAALQYMLAQARDAAHSVNQQMSHHKQLSTLETLMKQMEPYDVELPRDDEVKMFVAEMGTSLDLTQPMPSCVRPTLRTLMYRGDVKWREGAGKAIDAHCILFTDMLLVCKRKADKYKVIRPPVNVSRCIVRELVEYMGVVIVVKCEFSALHSVITLFGTSNDDVSRWAEYLSMAQQECQRSRHPQRKASVQTTISSSRHSSVADDLDGEHTPVVHRKSVSMDNNAVCPQVGRRAPRYNTADDTTIAPIGISMESQSSSTSGVSSTGSGQHVSHICIGPETKVDENNNSPLWQLVNAHDLETSDV